MAAPAVKSTLDRLLMTAADVYRKVEPLLDAKDKIQGGADAYARATHTLATGELQAHDETIEAARVKTKKLQAALRALSKVDENGWVDQSGAALGQPARMQRGISWLQQRNAEMTSLERLIEGQRPLVQGLKRALEHPAGMAIRVAIEPTSLHGLDIIALDEIDRNLGACSGHLRQIKLRLQNTLRGLTPHR